MARLTRHQMKQDDLSAQFASGLDYIQQNRRMIVRVAAAGAAALVLVLGLWFFIRSQQNQAAAAFEKALNTYHAPVLQSPPPVPDLESYTTDIEKNNKALEAFQSVADSYSFYAPGRMAKYYAAICLRDLERYPEAEKEFQALAQRSDGKVAPLAKLGLASVYELTQRPADAERIYKELEENPSETVPKLTALMARADLYRQTNPVEASTLLRQIQSEYPGTPAAEYAGAMLSRMPQ